jgi:hypothetical protein
MNYLVEKSTMKSIVEEENRRRLRIRARREYREEYMIAKSYIILEGEDYKEATNLYKKKRENTSTPTSMTKDTTSKRTSSAKNTSTSKTTSKNKNTSKKNKKKLIEKPGRTVSETLFSN